MGSTISKSDLPSSSHSFTSVETIPPSSPINLFKELPFEHDSFDTSLHQNSKIKPPTSETKSSVPSSLEKQNSTSTDNTLLKTPGKFKAPHRDKSPTSVLDFDKLKK